LVGVEATVDLVGDAPAQRPEGLGLGIACSGSTLQVVTTGTIQPQLGDGDAVQRGVELPVATPVQPMALVVARPDRDRRGPVVHRERRP
jgi:hypothetical protein